MHSPAPARPLRSPEAGFTLLELMVVIGIIAIALGLMAPALSPTTGRSIEGAARQFMADLENARQMAISERTKTRVLIADRPPPQNGFGSAFSDLPLRGYTIVSFDRTANTWTQRGRWNRLSQPATFHNTLPTRTPPSANDPREPYVEQGTEEDILAIRNQAETAVQSQVFTGPYVEFRPNGAASLDPADLYQVLVVADGVVQDPAQFTPKNKSLFYKLVIDPLTGSVRLK